MTDTGMPRFESLSEVNRRMSAKFLALYLRGSLPQLAVGYDDDRTVTLGPIDVRYLDRAVEISFPDDTDTGRRVAVYMPGKLTFAPVAAVVEGLVSGWQVTP